MKFNVKTFPNIIFYYCHKFTIADRKVYSKIHYFNDDVSFVTENNDDTYVCTPINDNVYVYDKILL